jgi:hypothetical protein
VLTVSEHKWLYLSFVGEDGQFLGAAYIQSHSDDGPLVGTTWQLDGVPQERISQIAIMEVPADKEQFIPASHKYHNVLLSKEDLRKASPGHKLVNTRGEPR